MHGGKSPGAPLKHGRRSHYIQILGNRFAELLSDPELLRSHEELALFDVFIVEQAERLGDGISSDWMAELRQAVAELREALSPLEAGTAAAEAFEALQDLVQSAGEHLGAWRALLAAARVRADIATKAAAVLARQDQAMTERDMIALWVRMLDLVKGECGAEAAQRVGRRFEVEVLAGDGRPRN